MYARKAIVEYFFFFCQRSTFITELLIKDFSRKALLPIKTPSIEVFKAIFSNTKFNQFLENTNVSFCMPIVPTSMYTNF